MNSGTRPSAWRGGARSALRHVWLPGQTQMTLRRNSSPKGVITTSCGIEKISETWSYQPPAAVGPVPRAQTIADVPLQLSQSSAASVKDEPRYRFFWVPSSFSEPKPTNE